jgi:AmmeMemoRadiSam system protein B
MQRPIRLIAVSALSVFMTFLFSVAAAKTVEIRKPVWAGKFYPETRSELLGTLATLSEKAAKTEVVLPQGKQLKAVVIPHAGYVYSGWTAAHAANILKGHRFRKVILMGPDHRVGFANVAVSDVAAYQTPLGEVPLHPDAGMLRARSPLFQVVPASDRMEHCLEVVLPFLQYALPEFLLVPMVMGHQTDVQKVSDQIAGMLDHNTLIVVSSDLSHYLPYPEAVKRDRETIRMILNLEDDRLATRENAACGVIPLCCVIRLAERYHWSPRLIHYSNSGDTAGTKDRVVGYTAIAFYGDNS